jgi:hypothetical protein
MKNFLLKIWKIGFSHFWKFIIIIIIIIIQLNSIQ